MTVELTSVLSLSSASEALGTQGCGPGIPQQQINVTTGPMRSMRPLGGGPSGTVWGRSGTHTAVVVWVSESEKKRVRVRREQM